MAPVLTQINKRFDLSLNYWVVETRDLGEGWVPQGWYTNYDDAEKAYKQAKRMWG